MKKLTLTLTIALSIFCSQSFAANLDQYLEISCSDIHLKKQTDPFLKKVQIKLKLIEQSKIADGIELKNSKNVSGLCEHLGDAQYSRLLDDEFLFLDKSAK